MYNHQTENNPFISPTNPICSPNPIDIYVGRRVIEKRSNYPYSRKAFAELLGLPENLLEKIERGKEKMPVSLLWYIAALLNEDILYFFKDIKPDNVNKDFKIPAPVPYILTDNDDIEMLFDENNDLDKDGA